MDECVLLGFSSIFLFGGTVECGGDKGACDAKPLCGEWGTPNKEFGYISRT